MKHAARAALIACVFALIACTHVVKPESGSTGPDAAHDAGTDRSTEEPPSSAPRGPSVAQPGICPAPAPNADPRPWKAPPERRAACSAADIQFFDQQWRDIPRPSFSTMESEMRSRSANCAACIFTRSADSAWGPIVFVGDAGEAIVNNGCCLMRVPGGTRACGQAFAQTDECMDTVCNGMDCATQSAMDSCVKGAVADARSCGRYDLYGACGGKPAFQSLYAQCATATLAVKVMCGSL